MNTTPWQVVIVGSTPSCFGLAAALVEDGLGVAVVTALSDSPISVDLARIGARPPTLVLAALAEQAALDRLIQDLRSIDGTDRLDSPTTPWLVHLSEAAPSSLAHEAYVAGALAVLPAESDVATLRSAIGRIVHRLGAPLPETTRHRPPTAMPVQRRHRAGSSVALSDHQVLLVRDGVIAQYTWHEDGTEGLLGLWGPSQAVLGHPDDTCSLTLRAHTDVVVDVLSWQAAAERPDIAELVRQRTLRLEGWASMQSRPNVEQRLVGILHWLAEQFGRPDSSGTVIDIRITHAQLAAAIGATRATVTRILGILRRRRVLAIKTTRGGERLLLSSSANLPHHPRSPVRASA